MKTVFVIVLLSIGLVLLTANDRIIDSFSDTAITSETIVEAKQMKPSSNLPPSNAIVVKSNMMNQLKQKADQIRPFSSLTLNAENANEDLSYSMLVVLVFGFLIVLALRLFELI